MVLKKNIPFLAILAVLVVAFLASLVWLHSQISARAKINKEIKATKAFLDGLRRGNPTNAHLDAANNELEQAEVAYAQLKKRLRTWWDSAVYDPNKSHVNPGLFLGDLQGLRDQIRRFAYNSRVALGTGVDHLSFPELLGADKPPPEVTYAMLKQSSVVRDILLLLIHENVESIDSLQFLREEQAEGRLYKKYLFRVSFTCTYPSLANFQADLVTKSKTAVDPYGEFPRNYLVIEELAYTTVDRKVASLEAAARMEEAGASETGTRSNTPSSRGIPPEFEYGRRAPRGETIPPYGTTRESETPRVGRPPNYNILNVTMTIALADFTKEITGHEPTPEQETRTATRNAERTPRTD